MAIQKVLHLIQTGTLFSVAQRERVPLALYVGSPLLAVGELFCVLTLPTS